MEYFTVSICTIVITLFSQFTYKKAISADNINARSVAEVRERLSITQNTDMDFGHIVPPSSSPVDVTIDNSGGDVIDSCPTDAVCYGSVSRAYCDITGIPDTAYTIAYTNGILSDGTNTMNVSVTNAAASNPSGGTIPSDGDDTLTFGGVLTVGANQTVGAYTTDNDTSFTITLSY